MPDISIDQIIQEIRTVALTHKTLDVNSYLGYVTKDEAQNTRVHESTNIVTMLHSVDNKLRKVKVYENIRPALVRYKYIIKNDKLIVDLYDLLKYEDVQFVENMYIKLLGREVDKEGLINNVNDLRLKRASKIDLILGIVASHEYNTNGKNVKIKHLRSNIRVSKISKIFNRIPIVGYLVRLMINLAFLNRSISQIEEARNVLSISGNEQVHELKSILKRCEDIEQSLVQDINEQVEQYNEQLAQYEHKFTQIKNRDNALEQVINQLVDKNMQLQNENQELKQYLNQVKVAITEESAKIENLSKFINAPQDISIKNSRIQEKYARFESVFCGDEMALRNKFQPYVKRVREHFVDNEISVLDIGCGKGEWLDELRKAGFNNLLGIDLSESMLQEARKKDINTLLGNGISYLKLQPDESLDLVSAFQVIEHLNNNDKIELISQAKRVLKPGGVLLLETPNPENVLVGSCNFYFDLTHTRPIPPDTLKFFVEDEGFDYVQVIRSSPLNYFDASQIDDELKHIAYRFNMEIDYAIWGCK